MDEDAGFVPSPGRLGETAAISGRRRKGMRRLFLIIGDVDVVGKFFSQPAFMNSACTTAGAGRLFRPMSYRRKRPG